MCPLFCVTSGCGVTVTAMDAPLPAAGGGTSTIYILTTTGPIITTSPRLYIDISSVYCIGSWLQTAGLVSSVVLSQDTAISRQCPGSRQPRHSLSSSPVPVVEMVYTAHSTVVQLQHTLYDAKVNRTAST